MSADYNVSSLLDPFALLFALMLYSLLFPKLATKQLSVCLQAYHEWDAKHQARLQTASDVSLSTMRVSFFAVSVVDSSPDYRYVDSTQALMLEAEKLLQGPGFQERHHFLTGLEASQESFEVEDAQCPIALAPYRLPIRVAHRDGRLLGIIEYDVFKRFYVGAEAIRISIDPDTKRRQYRHPIHHEVFEMDEVRFAVDTALIARVEEQIGMNDRTATNAPLAAMTAQ